MKKILFSVPFMLDKTHMKLTTISPPHPSFTKGEDARFGKGSEGIDKVMVPLLGGQDEGIQFVIVIPDVEIGPHPQEVPQPILRSSFLGNKNQIGFCFSLCGRIWDPPGPPRPTP